jgi:A/G-specific adenine glycosylase
MDSTPLVKSRGPSTSLRSGRDDARLEACAATRESFRRSLLVWFRKKARDLPWRHDRSPYAVLVSEMMLQQTQAATVADYFTRWLRRFPDFCALAAAEENDVLHAWQGLGYYARARNLHRAAKAVVAEHDGRLPENHDAICALPGIGDYTAAALMAFAFDRPAVVLDANVARVLARLFDMRKPVDSPAGKSQLRELASELQPPRRGRDFNEALMELGALVCLPRGPRCDACPVRKFCRAENPDSLPVKKVRRKTVPLEENCAWIVRGGRLLLEQQTGARWRGLWKLPALESRPPASQRPATTAAPVAPLFTTTYPFTHHRVALAVFARSAPQRRGKNQRWFSIAQLDAVPMTAPHRRAMDFVLKQRTSR